MGSIDPGSLRGYAVNGCNGSLGVDLSVGALADHLQCSGSIGLLAEEARKESKKRRRRGTIAGVDSDNLAEAGWGIVFSKTDPKAGDVEQALEPLLQLRRKQAGPRFRVFKGKKGYRWRQSAPAFLENLGVGSGPVDPGRGVPYYLLLVGDPQTIPFEFQYLLGLQFAVGRIFFDEMDGYRRYAETVERAETGITRTTKTVRIFAPHNEGDEPTLQSHHFLAKPVFQKLRSLGGWEVQPYFRALATKQNLARLLGGDLTPALLFTAGHGMMFSPSSDRLTNHQGALLCQDWPGPNMHEGRVPETYFFSGNDLGPNADLQGLVAFFFCCFGAGCPAEGNFFYVNSKQEGNLRDPQKLAPKDMLAQLPQSMLAHPRGALAVAAHVEQAWPSSFHTKKVAKNTGCFESVLLSLMQGQTLGSALEHLHQRYAELGARLSELLLSRVAGLPLSWQRFTEVWTAHDDLRNYIVLGDPAVRLAIARDQGASGAGEAGKRE